MLDRSVGVMLQSEELDYYGPDLLRVKEIRRIVAESIVSIVKTRPEMMAELLISIKSHMTRLQEELAREPESGPQANVDKKKDGDMEAHREWIARTMPWSSKIDVCHRALFLLKNLMRAKAETKAQQGGTQVSRDGGQNTSGYRGNPLDVFPEIWACAA